MILETICTALVKSETRKPEVDGMIVVPYLFCLLCRIFQKLQIAGLFWGASVLFGKFGDPFDTERKAA